MKLRRPKSYPTPPTPLEPIDPPYPVGSILTISGEPGKFLLKGATRNADTGEWWIDATSADPELPHQRSFRPERVLRSQEPLL